MRAELLSGSDSVCSTINAVGKAGRTVAVGHHKMLMCTLAFQHAETSRLQCEFQLKHVWGQAHSISLQGRSVSTCHVTTLLQLGCDLLCIILGQSCSTANRHVPASTEVWQMLCRGAEFWTDCVLLLDALCLSGSQLQTLGLSMGSWLESPSSHSSLVFSS